MFLYRSSFAVVKSPARDSCKKERNRMYAEPVEPTRTRNPKTERAKMNDPWQGAQKLLKILIEEITAASISQDACTVSYFTSLGENVRIGTFATDYKPLPLAFLLL